MFDAAGVEKDVLLLDETEADRRIEKDVLLLLEPTCNGGASSQKKPGFKLKVRSSVFHNQSLKARCFES